MLFLGAVVSPAPANAFHNGGCSTDVFTKQVYDVYSNGDIYGAQVQIDPSGTSQAYWFGPCYYLTTAFSPAGVAAYTQLEEIGNASHFVAVGVARCYNGGTGPCPNWLDYPPATRNFVGIGKCNGDIQLVDIGQGDFNLHNFSINRVSGPTRFEFRVDGVLKYSINLADSRIDCWSWNAKRVRIAGETTDNSDILGKNDTFTNRTLLQNPKARQAGSGTWTSYTPQCSISGYSPEHPLACASGGNFLSVWSENVP